MKKQLVTIIVLMSCALLDALPRLQKNQQHAQSSAGRVDENLVCEQALNRVYKKLVDAALQRGDAEHKARMDAAALQSEELSQDEKAENEALKKQRKQASRRDKKAAAKFAKIQAAVDGANMQLQQSLALDLNKIGQKPVVSFLLEDDEEYQKEVEGESCLTAEDRAMLRNIGNDLANYQQQVAATLSKNHRSY